ncbi:hypothetical protein [Oleiharenicola lentus]|uniref:hypothetical protein n=1 Tax=Oleiharenicola lentus TaxID=2508720 RepID=UPI003F671274
MKKRIGACALEKMGQVRLPRLLFRLLGDSRVTPRKNSGDGTFWALRVASKKIRATENQFRHVPKGGANRRKPRCRQRAFVVRRMKFAAVESRFVVPSKIAAYSEAKSSKLSRLCRAKHRGGKSLTRDREFVQHN